MKSRRKFLSKAAGFAGIFSLSSFTDKGLARSLSEGLQEIHNIPFHEALENEDIWRRIRNGFTVNPNIINLNNGGVSPQPKIVQDAVDRFYHYSNEGPAYYMWRILDRGRESVRRKLMLLAGLNEEQVAINRNTTEALDNVIFGMNLKKGDEVILTKQDYPNMISAWKQRALREGIKLVWLDLKMPQENPEEVVQAFIGATTKKTRVWHITHMINWNGQILPAQRLCEEARKRSILSVVDAAHSFAHIDYSIQEMNPDYLGTSLHKWLCAPFGTGMLYIKPEHIEKTWPLIPNHEPTSADLRKFEALGTRSFAPEQAISHAVDFHNSIGSKLKEERLHLLKNYWAEKVKDHPKIKLKTSLKKEYACALAVVDIEGKEPGEVTRALMNEYQIYTTGILWENIRGVRITPHVYTIKEDLDHLVDALLKISDSD